MYVAAEYVLCPGVRLPLRYRVKVEVQRIDLGIRHTCILKAQRTSLKGTPSQKQARFPQ
jgi:hypothetical protein